MKHHESSFLYDGVDYCAGAVPFTLAHVKTPTMVFVDIQPGIGRELALKHEQEPDNPESILLILKTDTHLSSPTGQLH